LPRETECTIAPPVISAFIVESCKIRLVIARIVEEHYD